MRRVVWINLAVVIGVAISLPMVYGQRKQEKQGAPASAAAVGRFGNVDAITADGLKDYLYFVASDEMEGRDTPSRGLDITAKFLALNLSHWGIKPMGDGEGRLDRYFQKFALNTRTLLPETTTAVVNGQELKVGQDFLTTGASGVSAVYPGTAAGPLIYVGSGLVVKAKNINSYQNIDVKDKILVVADAYARGVNYKDLQGKVGEDYDRAESYAAAHGAKGVIYLPSPSTVSFWEQRHTGAIRPSRPQMQASKAAARVPAITVSEKIAASLFQGEKLNYEAIKKQMGEGAFSEAFDLTSTKQASFKIDVKVESLLTQNVVGVLEGSDPVLKEEYIAIGAHYDHVGVRRDGEGDRIFNGADDDGSGTVATLSIAEALAKGPKPKRSYLFVWHAGEEKGLWGSEFMTDHPVVPINKIIAQLNIDMIGRSKKPGDTNPRNAALTGPDELYVIGSHMMSTELARVSEEVNHSYLKLKFDYKYDAPNDPERFFYRSDHYNYARKGIPIIFYFDGVHEDYHGVGDQPEKIDYEKMEKVTRTIFATGWTLANNATRPKVDKPLPAQLAGN